MVASDFVELSGKASNSEDTSGLFARSRGTGDAGSISITTRELIIQGQAQVTVSGTAAGTGTAGSLKVDGEQCDFVRLGKKVRSRSVPQVSLNTNTDNKINFYYTNMIKSDHNLSS